MNVCKVVYYRFETIRSTRTSIKLVCEIGTNVISGTIMKVLKSEIMDLKQICQLEQL